MLYHKHTPIDLQDRVERRIHKISQQRLKVKEFFSHFDKYLISLKEVVKHEEKLKTCITELYESDSRYEQLVKNFSTALAFKHNIKTRSISSMKAELDKQKSFVDSYLSLKPKIKEYFENKAKDIHYTKKLRMLVEFSGEDEKKSQKAVEKERQRLERNRRKNEVAKKEYSNIRSEVEQETNQLNIRRFDFLNSVVKEFISAELASNYLMKEKYQPLNDFEMILDTAEKESFNGRYFDNKEKKQQESQKNPFYFSLTNMKKLVSTNNHSTDKQNMPLTNSGEIQA